MSSDHSMDQSVRSTIENMISVLEKEKDALRSKDLDSLRIINQEKEQILAEIEGKIDIVSSAISSDINFKDRVLKMNDLLKENEKMTSSLLRAIKSLARILERMKNKGGMKPLYSAKGTLVSRNAKKESRAIDTAI